MNQGGQRGTPPQNPGQQQQYAIPKERFDEINNRYKAVEQQNQELRRQVDFLYQQTMQQQQRQQPAPVEDSPFEPNTARAIESMFQKKLDAHITPLANRFQQQIGGLADENDRLQFMLKYGPDQYKKHQQTIEQLRQEKAQQNVWLSREDAFKFVHFDETNRKPRETPVQPMGAAVDPYTGEIVQPQAAPQQPQYQQPQQPPQQFQQPQQTAPQEPWDEPELPPAGIVEGGYQPPVQPGSQKLSISSDEAALDAWANKFGEKQF